MSERMQQIEARQATVAKLMEAEPQGMVSKPHICWATDQLSHAEHDIDWLRARLAALENVAAAARPHATTEKVALVRALADLDALVSADRTPEES